MNSRVAPRRPAAKCPWITGVRLAPIGGDASLVNISWSGVMVRCAKRVAPGMALTVVFEGTLTPSTLKGRVARCEVGGIGGDGSILYNVGIGFDEPISLPDEDDAPEPEAAEAAPEPVVQNRW